MKNIYHGKGKWNEGLDIEEPGGIMFCEGFQFEEMEIKTKQMMHWTALGRVCLLGQ